MLQHYFYLLITCQWCNRLIDAQWLCFKSRCGIRAGTRRTPLLVCSDSVRCLEKELLDKFLLLRGLIATGRKRLVKRPCLEGTTRLRLITDLKENDCSHPRICLRKNHFRTSPFPNGSSKTKIQRFSSRSDVNWSLWTISEE